jgi:heme O synthase-like polyprenyltransferase
MVQKSMELIKTKLGFILTFISVMGLLLLAWFKDVDIEMSLPTVLAIYLGGRTAAAMSHVWAASKDEKADTVATIKELEKRD